MRKPALLALLAALACAPAALAASAPNAAAALGKAEKLVEKQDPKAEAALEAVIAAPGYEALTDDQRRAALTQLISFKLGRGDLAGAQVLAKELTANPVAGRREWTIRMGVAGGLGDYTDLAVSLAQIARNWPAGLVALDDNMLVYSIDLARLRAAPQAYLKLMQALDELHWTPKDPKVDAGVVWAEYAAALLDLGDTARASAVLHGLRAPLALVSIQADRRFARLVAEDPAAFDPLAAADRSIAEARAAAERTPDDLQAQNAYVWALLQRGRAAEALKAVDAVIAARPSPAGEDVARVMWARRTRLAALGQLGRFTDMLDSARRLAEETHQDGDRLTLANLQMLAREPQAALATLDTVRLAQPIPDLVQYVDRIRVCSVAQMGDPKALEAVASAAKSHNGGRLAILPALCAGETQAAAENLIANLADPQQRLNTLWWIQHYRVRDVAGGWGDELTARIDQLVARPDVRDVLDRVGAVRSYDLAGSF
jgi:hypothetical protein